MEAEVARGGAVGRRDRGALAAGLHDRGDAEVRNGRGVAAFVAAAAADVFDHGLAQADIDEAPLVELKLSNLRAPKPPKFSRNLAKFPSM